MRRKAIQKKNNHHLATLSTVNSIEKNSTEDRYAEAIPYLSQHDSAIVGLGAFP